MKIYMVSLLHRATIKKHTCSTMRSEYAKVKVPS